MKRLGNDGALLQTKYVLGPHDGIQSSKTGIITGDGRCRHAGGHQRIPHVSGLIIGGNMVIAADEEMVDFTSLIKSSGSGNALIKVQIGMPVFRKTGGSQHQTDLIGRDTGNEVNTRPEAACMQARLETYIQPTVSVAPNKTTTAR